MTFLRTPLMWSTAAVVCFAGSVDAQELASEILEEYFADTVASGLTVTIGSKTASGDTVEWSNIVLAPSEGRGELMIPWIKATELGNGKVELDIAPKSTGRMSANNVDELVIDVMVEGDRTIVSGSPEARTYAVETEKFGMSLQTADGFMIDVTGQGSTSQWARSSTDIPHFVGTSLVDKIRVKMDLSQDGQVVKQEQTLSNISASFDLDAVAPKDLEGALGEGVRQEMALEFGEGRSTTKISQPGMDAIIEQSFEGGNGLYLLADGAIRVEFNGLGQSGKMTMPALGLPPMEFSAAGSEVLFEMPLIKSEKFKQGNLKFALQDVVLPEQIWGLFDPTGVLPRDPANISFDTGVSMKWLVDVTDPKTLEAASELASPAEIDKIDIRDITVQMAGLSVAVTGAGKVSNDGPFPMPYGEMNVDLRGAFALIDKLVQIGLIPTEQAMMAKGMSSMFTSAGPDGAGHLTSFIEMKKSGSIVVNGVPIN